MTACAAVLVTLGMVWILTPEGVPSVTEATGTGVILQRAGQVLNPQAGTRLAPGDLLQTDGAATAVVSYGREATRIELKPNAVLKLAGWSSGKRFELRQGRMEATVARQRWFHSMTIATVHAEARVLGTKFTLTTTTNATRLDVTEGKVRLTRTADGARVDVPKGHYAIAATNAELHALPQTGGVLREIWTGIPGGEVNDLLDHPSYPGLPAHRDVLKSFETGAVETNNYACRLIGYIHPPITGDYTFWIASGGYGALWLSPDEDPLHKVRIAAARRWDVAKPWGDLQMPESPQIRLVAGRRYFIQAVQKTATGFSHLEVAWKTPGAERQVISGDFLSPYKPND